MKGIYRLDFDSGRTQSFCMHAVTAYMVIPLDNCEHLGTGLKHLICDYKAYISAADNDHTLTGQDTVDVCHGLCRTGEHYAGKSRAGERGGVFNAACGDDHLFCLDYEIIAVAHDAYAFLEDAIGNKAKRPARVNRSDNDGKTGKTGIDP